MRSGLATCFSVPPLWPTWPPLFLPDLPRRLCVRGGFFSPSLDGGLLLFELFLFNRRSSSAIFSRNSAFSRRNQAPSSREPRSPAERHRSTSERIDQDLNVRRT